MDCSPPGSAVHGDSPGKNTEVGCHAFLMLSPSVLFIKLIMFSFVLLILLILLKSNWPISTLSEHIVQHTIISHSEPHSGLVLVQQLIMYLPPDLRKEYIYFLKCSSSRVSMLMKQ